MQMTKKNTSAVAAVALFLLALASTDTAVAFAPPTSPVRRPVAYTQSLLFRTIQTGNSDGGSSTANQLRASTAANSQPNPDSNDALLRALEKKEASILQKRDDAKAKLSEAEQTLQSIQLEKQAYLNGDSLADSPPGGNFKETALRSAVKAFAWRIIAGSVTFFTSLRFSGSLTTALSIVGSDFFSKAFTMFIGERLMNKSQAGRKSGADGAGRSLAKALIWRLFAICNTLTMAVFVAKDLSIASKIAGSDAVFKTALMFFYERVWAKIEWGKEYEIEFSI